LPQKITPALTVRAVAPSHFQPHKPAPTVRLKVSLKLHAVMPFALAASFVTAALVSCIPLRSVILHSTTLRSVLGSVQSRYVWVMRHFTSHAHNHKLHSCSCVKSTSLHSVRLHSAKCSPPAALVVLACAVVRAAGCHDFCIPSCWPCHIQLLSTIRALCKALHNAHNHPSGALQPSQADIELTKKIKEGGKLLDIQVLDHIIITSEAYYSFADEGLL
jgi:hypothetical protein